MPLKQRNQTTPVQWDLSSLIVPAKTSVEGHAGPLCF